MKTLRILKYAQHLDCFVPVTFEPGSITLPNGETVSRGQLVEYCSGGVRFYNAVIVDWSSSGKTLTLHKATLCRASTYGSVRVTLRTDVGGQKDRQTFTANLKPTDFSDFPDGLAYQSKKHHGYTVWFQNDALNAHTEAPA
jgi:hypothetical protein